MGSFEDDFAAARGGDNTFTIGRWVRDLLPVVHDCDPDVNWFRLYYDSRDETGIEASVTETDIGGETIQVVVFNGRGLVPIAVARPGNVIAWDDFHFFDIAPAAAVRV